MFSTIRRLLEAAERCASGLARIATQLGPTLEARTSVASLELRIQELELAQATWEASMEAELLKAESTYKSAQNSESRARTMKRNYAKIADELDPDRLEELALEGRRRLQDHDAEVGEEEGVQPVPLDLETNGKAAATRMKWGL